MTNEPTPETDAMLASDPRQPSDWPAFACALEIQRNAARAELDKHIACNWPAYACALEIQRNAARAQRDEHIARNNDSLLALHLTIAERDEARADVARLRAALEGMLIAEMRVRKAEGWTRSEADAEPHWMAARAALAK
jgi:hypothetical protein